MKLPEVLPGEPVPAAERRRLQRWIAAVGMLSIARDRRGPDVPETNAIAHLAAHTACEAMLGLIVGVREDSQSKDPTKGDPPFGQMLQEAAVIAKLERDLVAELQVVHRTRNGFVHGGQVVASLEVDRAVESAARLATYVPAPGHDRAAGVATVIAEIIQVDTVGAWLRHFDDMVSRGRLDWAGDGLVRALDEAIRRAKPAIRRKTGMSAMQSSAQLRDMESGPSRPIRDPFPGEARQAIDTLTRWVLPLALGVAPATWTKLEATIGIPAGYDLRGHPDQVHRPREHPPTADDLRWAAGVVGEIILRLWSIGSLESRPGDEELLAIWAPFLANPSGVSAGEKPVPKSKVPPPAIDDEA